MQIISYIVAVAAIIATIANAYKKRWSFIVWLFTNGFWCIYDFSIGAHSQGLQFGVYFIISLIGLRNWRKKDEAD